MMGPPQTQVDLVVNSSEGATLGAGGAARRAWEEAEQLKMRMADPHFDFKKYPDPLRPRLSSTAHYFPPGVTAEMEKKWLAAIEASK